MTTKDLTIVLAAFVCAVSMTEAGLAQEEGQAGVLLGRVVDDESGDAIEAVQVRFIGVGDELVRATDSEGEFMISRVQPGTYEVALEHIAYGSHTDTVRVGRGELVKYEVRLAARPIELEPLAVTVQRRSVPPTLLGFYERMEKGRGRFITREDIDNRNPGRITQVIGSISTIRVRMEGASSRFYVEFSRYRGCPPAVYLDGMLVNPMRGERAVIDDYVMPGEVEAIEAYDSPGSLPAEFGGTRAGCGVIVIWTRRGM